MNFTQLLRTVVLIEGAVVIGLALVAAKHARQLSRSQPDGRMPWRINILAYLAIAIAGFQAMVGQVIRLRHAAPLNWYGAPLMLVWMSMLIVWFWRRVRWHVENDG